VAALDQKQEASRARDAMKGHEVLVSGILSGIAGGVAMLGVAMIGAESQGIEPMHPVKVIGETFVGPGAFDGEATKIAFGAFVHLVVSGAFGLLVASVVPRDFPAASAVGVGVGFALFGLMFMMTLVVPWANPGFRGNMQDVGGTWIVAHAVFGVVLGTTPALRRWLAREASDASAPELERVRLQAGRVARTTRTS
jgi:hypothetical protein